MRWRWQGRACVYLLLILHEDFAHLVKHACALNCKELCEATSDFNNFASFVATYLLNI